MKAVELRNQIAKLTLFALLACAPAFCGYNGYLLFQTVPSKAGTTPSAPYLLLIEGTFPAFATVANGGNVVNTTTCGLNSITCPADLIFTQDSGCLAPFGGWDVLSWSPVTGQLTVQVKIPLLATTRPIRIFGCAGNSVVTTFQGGARGAAYDNNYLLALHMDETSGTVLHDSTANANDAVKKVSANPNPTPTAVVGGAQKFVGTTSSTNNDYALLGAPTAPANTYTVEYWTNATSFINTDAVFLESDGAGGGPVVYLGFYWFPGVARFVNSWNTGFSPFEPAGANVAPGAFHYIVFMRNGDTVTMYVDGVAGPPLAGYGLQAEEWSALGWNGGANAVFDSYNGILDEVFYSNIARGPDYVTARYNNVTSPSTFYTVSAFTPAPVLVRSTTQANSQVSIFTF